MQSRDERDAAGDEPSLNDKHPNVGKDLREDVAAVLGVDPDDLRPRR